MTQSSFAWPSSESWIQFEAHYPDGKNMKFFTYSIVILAALSAHAKEIHYKPDINLSLNGKLVSSPQMIVNPGQNGGAFCVYQLLAVASEDTVQYFTHRMVLFFVTQFM